MGRKPKDDKLSSFKDTSFIFEGGKLTIIIRKEIVRLAFYTPDDKLSMGYYSHDKLIQLLLGYAVYTSRNNINGIITSVYKTKLDIETMELVLFILDEDLDYIVTKEFNIIEDMYLKETRLRFSPYSWGIFVGHLKRITSEVL